MSWWNRYWFAPAPYFDLAVVRLLAVALQLVILLVLFHPLPEATRLAAAPASLYDPILIFNLMNLPFGWGYRPDYEVLQLAYYLALAAGVLSLVGLLTNASLVLFTLANVYLQAFLYSFGDFHHPQAVMMVALGLLALGPSGRVLSLDAWLRRRRQPKRAVDPLEAASPFARWPLLVLQWFFVLMYLSAVFMKMSASGHDWMNGFTLQYYLLQDGLRWDSPLALWLAQYHELIVLAQYFVIGFQATFALAVIFPKLRWLYVPAGLALHGGIYLTLTAPFFQWIILYAVFIPWAEAARRVRGWLAGSPSGVSAGRLD